MKFSSALSRPSDVKMKFSGALSRYLHAVRMKFLSAMSSSLAV